MSISPEQLAIDALRDAYRHVPSRMFKQMQMAMQAMVKKYGDHEDTKIIFEENARIMDEVYATRRQSRRSCRDSIIAYPCSSKTKARKDTMENA